MELQEKEQEIHERIIEKDSGTDIKAQFGIYSIKNSDELVKVYTGLPTYALFSWLFEDVKEPAQNMNYFKSKTSSTEAQTNIIKLMTRINQDQS